MEQTEIRIEVPTVWLDKIKTKRALLSNELLRYVSQKEFILGLIKKAADD